MKGLSSRGIQSATPGRSGGNRIARWRFVAAFAVAVLADTLGAPLGESLAVVFDLAVGVVLALLLGFRIELLIACVLEAIPGVGLFPFWSLAVPELVLRHPSTSVSDEWKGLRRMLGSVVSRLITKN